MEATKITNCLVLIASFVVCIIGAVHDSAGCQSHEFSCFNGQCISKMLWCDGELDCFDSYDERFCRVDSISGKDPNQCRGNKDLFLCANGKCIPRIGVCDGLKTCDDGSDEVDCGDADSYIEGFAKSEQDYFDLLTLESSQPGPKLKVDDSKHYSELTYDQYRNQMKLAREWLLSQQKDDFGWGDYTARAIIAMYLSKLDSSPKDKKEMLMDKQLDIELSIALTRNLTKEITLSELALYINSLVASCKNPRNFYGYDLVKILRERTNVANVKRSYINPYVHLTLCLNNATNFEDIKSIQNLHEKFRSTSFKTDTLSLAVLTSICVTRLPQYKHPQFLRNTVQNLLTKIKASGIPRNVYELALVIQALNEAKIDPNEWQRSEAMDFILNSQDKIGSFGDILATYYTIPLLSGRSIFTLSDHCNEEFESNGFIPLPVLKNTRRPKISVVYSLFFGDPVEMTQTIQLQVPEGTNFLDIMRLAQEENPNFRFNLDDSKSNSFVYSIGGIPNDAERGLYWTLHVASPYNTSHNDVYTGDLRQYIPLDGQKTIYWLKPM